MKLFFQCLCLVIVLELLCCGGMFYQRLTRTVPVLPGEGLVDSSIIENLQQLADRTETGNDEDWTALGHALTGNGFYNYAEPCYREALFQNPLNDDAKFHLAFCLDRTGRTEASTQLYREVANLKSGSSKAIALYAIGRNYLREENIDSAEKTFREIKSYAPADFQLAKLFYRAEKYDEALQIVNKNLQSMPLSVRFLDSQYQLLDAQNNQQALQRTRDLQVHANAEMDISYSGGVTSPLIEKYGLGTILDEYQLEYDDDAIEIKERDKKLEELLRLTKDRKILGLHRSLLQMAAYELKRQQPDRALSLLQKIRAMGHNFADLNEMEGDAWEMRGDRDKAAAAWMRALQMFPYSVLHQKLANFYALKQQPTERDYHMAKATLLAGITAFREYQLPKAEQAIKVSLKLNQNDAQAWYYLGEIFLRMNRHSNARTAFNQCLEIDPNYTRAIRQLSSFSIIPNQ